ncbi:Morphine 6-dehydrogenase [Amycolatopsis sp. M39]|nr:Morphine 6-dehydrogenase [Amycolatopsis sp. M39]
MNQVELHPYFAQPALQRADAARGILTQAWSPIGGITFYWDADGSGRRVLAEPSLRRIAEAHGKTAAQVVLRWHLQQGRSAIPKSTHPERIAENMDIFDFALSSDELAVIDALDTGVRSGPDPTAANPSRFEIRIPEA